jgi:hypothetical protein
VRLFSPFGALCLSSAVLFVACYGLKTKLAGFCLPEFLSVSGIRFFYATVYSKDRHAKRILY